MNFRTAESYAKLNQIWSPFPEPFFFLNLQGVSKKGKYFSHIQGRQVEFKINKIE